MSSIELQPAASAAAEPIIDWHAIGDASVDEADFLDIDDIAGSFESDPKMAQYLTEARRELAESFYAGDVSLVALRLRRGWSQAQLAERANTSQPYVARIEAGELNPRLETVERLAKALDVSLGQLAEIIRNRKVED